MANVPEEPIYKQNVVVFVDNVQKLHNGWELVYFSVLIDESSLNGSSLKIELYEQKSSWCYKFVQGFEYVIGIEQDEYDGLWYVDESVAKSPVNN